MDDISLYSENTTDDHFSEANRNGKIIQHELNVYNIVLQHIQQINNITNHKPQINKYLFNSQKIKSTLNSGTHYKTMTTSKYY